MEPTIGVITLGVDDLEKSLEFYRDGLGLKTDGVIGTEFKGDDEHPAGAIALFELRGGLILALYPRRELAKDAHGPVGARSATEFSIGHLVGSKDEVDNLIRTAVAAGGLATEQPHERPWGIYSGYFQDPDGHLWEIIWNPSLSDS
jgi:catechol 2,3-dioxygenase-like lactoylglutathione lyase family enzyme